jgi:hypothetical protein
MMTLARPWPLFPAAALLAVLSSGPGLAEESLTRDVPISEFQNKATDVKPYNFDAPPEGMFRSIQVTRGFEEELGFRRAHEIVPVNPTETFPPGSIPVFLVFSLHQHVEPFLVIGLCFPEHVAGLDPKTELTRDEMYIALEDESGYLKLNPPPGGWRPGKYKVEVHIGWKVTDISLIGTMRFTVAQADTTTSIAPNSK